MNPLFSLRHCRLIAEFACASFIFCLGSSSQAANITFEDVQHVVADNAGRALSNPSTIGGIVFRTDASNPLINCGKDFFEGSLFSSDYLNAGVYGGTTNFTMTFPQPITYLAFETTTPWIGVPAEPMPTDYRLTSPGNSPVFFTSTRTSLDLIEVSFANPTSQVAIAFVSGYTYTLSLDNLRTTAVPEPSALVLAGIAALSLLGYTRRTGVGV